MYTCNEAIGRVLPIYNIIITLSVFVYIINLPNLLHFYLFVIIWVILSVISILIILASCLRPIDCLKIFSNFSDAIFERLCK